MRSPVRFAIAILVALGVAELVTWVLGPPQLRDPVRFVRVAQLAVLGFVLARRRNASEARLAVLGFLGAVALEEVYLVVYGAAHDWRIHWGRLVSWELVFLAGVRGLGVSFAARRARWIDGLLLAGPLVCAEFLLTFWSSLRALGENFSVGAVTPQLGITLAWGATVAVLIPLVGGTGSAQRA